MKRIALSIVLMLALSAAVAAQYAAGRMDLPEFQKLHAAGKVLVVDVRDERSFLSGHIPSSINIPLGTEPMHAGRLKLEKRPIVTYCA